MTNGQTQEQQTAAVVAVEENVSPQLRIVMNAYGWETKAEMKASPEYQDALKRGGNSPSEAFRLLTESEQDVRGFFQSVGVGWKRGKGKSKGEPHGFKAVILTEDGRPVSIQTDENIYKDFKTMQRVVAGPFQVKLDLKDPDGPAIVKEIEGKQPTIRAEEHDAEIPSVRADFLYQNAMKRTSKKDTWSMGTIAGKSRGLVTGTIGGADSIWVVWEQDSEFAKFDHVACLLTDEAIVDGETGAFHMHTLKPKIPVEDIKAQLGIDVAEYEQDDIKDILAGRGLILYGEFGVTNPADFSEAAVEQLASLTGKKREQAADALPFGQHTEQVLKELRGLFDRGMLTVPPKSKTGNPKLDLRQHPADHVVIGGHRVFGVEYDAKEKHWKLDLHCDDLERPYWFNVRERDQKRTKEDGTEEKFKGNQGGFAMFVDAIDGEANVKTVYDELADELA